MKKAIGLSFLSIALLFTACVNNNPSKENNNKSINNIKNDLISSDVIVEHLFALENEDNPNWLEGVDFNQLLEITFKNVMKAEVEVLNPYDDKSTMTVDEIEQRIEVGGNDTIDIKWILFKESWIFNIEQFKLERNVISWTPIRALTKEDGKIIKQKLFTIKNSSDNSNNEIIANNIRQSLKLYNDGLYAYIDEEKPKESLKRIEDYYLHREMLKSLDDQHFINLLINHVMDNKVEVYKASDSEIKLSKEMIEYNLGIGVDTTYFEDEETGEIQTHITENKFNIEEINSLVFIEDWYFNENNLSITKKIKGIGPVRYYYKESLQDLAKRIVFVAYFDKDRHAIL